MPEPARAPAPQPEQNGGPTVVGPRAHIVGDLSGDENIHVEGRLSGKIRVAGEVSVGSGGQVEGDIHARTVVVSGRVRGEIVAEERVELAASASVEGTVHAPKIVIAEGARLEGNVAMSGGSGSALEETEG